MDATKLGVTVLAFLLITVAVKLLARRSDRIRLQDAEIERLEWERTQAESESEGVNE